MTCPDPELPPLDEPAERALLDRAWSTGLELHQALDARPPDAERVAACAARLREVIAELPPALRQAFTARLDEDLRRGVSALLDWAGDELCVACGRG